jgi:hypothetical protein
MPWNLNNPARIAYVRMYVLSNIEAAVCMESITHENCARLIGTIRRDLNIPSDCVIPINFDRKSGTTTD